jgi:hypothetical protein
MKIINASDGGIVSNHEKDTMLSEGWAYGSAAGIHILEWNSI